jgi:hypothetical protein
VTARVENARRQLAIMEANLPPWAESVRWWRKQVAKLERFDGR